MKPWLRFAAKLYPKAWRERYAPELDALLEDMDARWTDLLDVLRSAIGLQMRTSMSYWKLAAAIGALGAILGVAVSFLTPSRYVSSAILRSTQPANLDQEPLSRASLSGIIQRLDLYHGERYREPLEDVIENMRQNDLQVARINTANGSAVRIAFAYPDRVQAQAVVRELSSRFAVSRSRFEVLDAASLPQDPIAPRRLQYIVWGLVLGVLCGLLASITMRRPKRTMQIAGFGLAGCALATAASFLIANQYVSTAVVRGDDGFEKQLISTEVLSDLIQNPALNLYPEQRKRMPLDTVAKQMLEKDLRINRINREGFGSTYRISFVYPDRLKAQLAVRALTSQTARLEILDSASYPIRPSAPNRYTIAALGLALGLLPGGVFARRRHA